MEEEMIKSIKRSIEILDPKHREHYEDIGEINLACEMGRAALKKLIPVKPIRKDTLRYGVPVFECGECGNSFTGRISDYCYRCGQMIDWNKEEETEEEEENEIWQEIGIEEP